jgi:hypothetical protein
MSESRTWAWTYTEIEKDLETRWDKQAARDYTDDLFNSKQNRLTQQETRAVDKFFGWKE